MRRPIVLGNWKMNGTCSSTPQLLEEILTGMAKGVNAEVGVCVPFIFLPITAEKLNGSILGWGSQNVADQDIGAYTGEISAAMLKQYGCRFAIVGHSERRCLYYESNDLVARRFDRACAHDLVPILCVGETIEQRESNATFEVIYNQLSAVLRVSGINSFSNAIIAYEPVWAIGTGKTATPEQTREVHAYIRRIMTELNPSIGSEVRIIYGGSVNPDNARTLFSMDDIDGGLIGGASLDAESFLSIIQSADSGNN